MDRYKFIFVFINLLSICSCEISYEKKNKLVNAFIEFYNSLPNQIYNCEEGFLQNAQQTEVTNSYAIEVNLKVSALHNPEYIKYLKCTSTVADLEDGAAVLNHRCEETSLGGEIEEVVTETSTHTTETPIRTPVQLDNEIQTNIAVTSGEQFIAIPREEPKVSCIGCSSHVNPQAQGVNELASIGVRHLNSIEPNVKHTLHSVVDVERQVQVVNGIRYILTLIVNYNSCQTQETESCLDTKTCKVTILEKPWMPLPGGSKYRAILANNCTEEWLFGDDGVVIPQTPADNREHNNINPPQGTHDTSDIIKPIHNVDVQAQQHTEKTLTDDDIKIIEQQIIPHKQFDIRADSDPNVAALPSTSETPELSKEHVLKVESASPLTANSIPVTDPLKIETLSEEKKKAIDDMLSFFNFAGFDSTQQSDDDEKTRLKRSYDKDLNVMNLVEKFKKVKKHLENAKYIYKLAQYVVDYVNEIDLEVKTRVLKDVINAEEEFENHQHFYYIQSRVVIPCDKSVCEDKDSIPKICNAVLDCTDKNIQILSVFCHDEPKTKFTGNVKSVPEDDPVLLKLVKEAIDKIESESSNKRALNLNKIIDANIQRVSGTLTKFTIILNQMNCIKTVTSAMRKNCYTIEELGSQICEVTIHERHWLKERTITYSCEDRPVDSIISSIRKVGVQKSVNDPVILEMAQEALQYLEVQSNRNNKQVVVRVNSVATQLVAGFLTDIEFVVGYTTCTNDAKFEISKCKLLEEEPLRICKAKVWDRTWIEDGRRVDVSCKEPNTKDNELPKRAKRHASMIERGEHETNSNSINRKKRGVILGGEKKQDPNDPKYRELAEKSMKKYLTSNGNTNLHTVVFIDRVTTQVVSGFKIKLDFKITPASQTNGDIINCHSEIWQQPWNNREDINVTCGIDNKSRTKRSIPGGQKDADPNDPKYRELAEKSMKKYLTSNGNTNSHRIVIIENVTEQVVAGTKIQLNFKITPADQTNGDVISCHSEIWQQFWVNKEDITVNCDIDNKSRAKRQLPGGPRDQDPNDPKYRELAEKSMRKYLQSNGNTNFHRIVSIEKVTTQDVSGTRTFIKFKMTPTNQPNGDTISCLSDIWQQPWNGKDDITVNCYIDYQSYARTGIDIVGGEKVQDVGDPKFKELAKQSLQKFLQTSGGNQHYSLISIERATVQVVAGTITRLEFQISATDCQLDNQGKPSSSNCKVLDASNVILCSSKIFEQKWLKNLDFDVKCHIDDDNNRIKRELPEESTDQETKHKVARSKIGTFHNKGKTNKAKGGINEEDPTKKTYKILAQESLAKYLKIKKITERHRIVEVKKVTSQVVSGMIYNIDFVAAPKACAHDILTCEDETLVLHCNARVLSQLWLNKKEIDVSCGEQHGKRPTRKLKQKDEGINEEERREKRQTADDDYIDDDTKFYYGDRVLKELNDNSHSRNLHKLVTIHSAQTGYEMGRAQVRMYIETVETYCLRHRDEIELSQCEELEGMTHRLCFATIWPSPEDELVIEQINVVCDDDEKFETTTGLSIAALLRASIKELERSPNAIYKLVHQGEPQLIPTLSQNVPTLMNFVVATTNCSKDIQIDFSKPIRTNCFLDITMPSKACYSLIWLAPNNRDIQKIKVTCKRAEARKKRSVSLDHSNSTADDLIIKKLVQESLEKLEMASPSRYKQRMLSINSFSTKITSGKVTTIDFDVGYTSCLKFEWVEDVKTCDLLEHLPRRRCVSQVWERLWINNGRNIEVTCEDDETPLEARVEFENADSAYSLANEALKHIEAKYPHPRKQKVVRIFSLEKQVVAGIHYRMKLEVGSTQCFALSAETNCTLLKKDENNKFCRVNVWLRPWTDHPPNFRVTCDYQEAASSDLYHQIQAEQLFRDFLTVYKPDYINDHQEMTNRFEIFRENIRRIHELNTHERGTARYGLTRFADLSYEEFGKRFLGLKPSFRDANQLPMRQAEIPSSLHIPDKFDWRDYDAVTEVKNQGSCGSCWAFSVTGNIEGQWKMQSGKLVSLSEQELVDCDKLDQGCNGGLPDNAYRAIEQLGGLELENDYPYEGEDDQCAFNKTMSRVQISGAVNITSNETDMAKWLVQNGPISIGINANAMQFYMGGVSHPWKMLCNPGNLDHGVLIVGYGTKNYPVFHKRLPFWTIKNSWGPEWGEQGYYRVYRGDGTCGVNMMASSAVI